MRNKKWGLVESESESETNFFIGADSQSSKLEDNQVLQIRGRLKHFQSATAKKLTQHQTPIPINDIDSYTFAQ